MLPQNLYKVLALVMMFIGGLAAYTVVWDLGDVGVGLMTVFKMCSALSDVRIRHEGTEILWNGEEEQKKRIKNTRYGNCS